MQTRDLEWHRWLWIWDQLDPWSRFELTLQIRYRLYRYRLYGQMLKLKELWRRVRAHTKIDRFCP
jgi:hypothetical protein